MATVLITGASRGIGAELARRYHARGDRVIATMRSPATADLPDGIEKVALDVRSEAGQLAASERIGPIPIDLLICNAGVLHGRGGLTSDGYSEDEWAQTLMTNVAGVFFTIRSFQQHLEATKGKIAVISSQMGSSTQAKGSAYSYRASKAAATNLALSLSDELRERGIAIAAYHPGWVQTDMGGASAAISVEDSAVGLMAEFDALSLSTTGSFRQWNGAEMPI
ncbi:SDR family oxidoreductase [Pontivivens insulae]|uniref:C-factor n=1 Tax=Pontivivens insulae TaxID=1639689 RepID=A0A2R8AD45_9RHOB|nr:SDR family oxidoreductase [Pontivivens insulae]RED13931.1 NAD(P)-dependent dehydrogenase (short-subunit alcohol dehydrogenase family) [Pontivivens insulae]SPF30005.1 C-factor [Pontivivens insulae]